MMRDSLGLIVSPDGGDTLAREADYCFCMQSTYRRAADINLARLEIGWGYWTRHPSLDPMNCSRDQLITLIVFLGMSKDYGRLTRLLLRTILRLGFAQNWKTLDGKWKVPDSMHLFGSLFLRAYNWWFTVPMLVCAIVAVILGPWISWCYWLATPMGYLLLCDLNGVIGTLWDVRPWRDPDDTDDTNTIAQHYQGIMFVRSPLSALAAWLYIKYRPRNNGNFYNHEAGAVMGAVSWYFKNPEFSANEEFIELYRPAVIALAKEVGP